MPSVLLYKVRIISAYSAASILKKFFNAKHSLPKRIFTFLTLYRSMVKMLITKVYQNDIWKYEFHSKPWGVLVFAEIQYTGRISGNTCWVPFNSPYLSLGVEKEVIVNFVYSYFRFPWSSSVVFWNFFTPQFFY